MKQYSHDDMVFAYVQGYRNGVFLGHGESDHVIRKEAERWIELSGGLLGDIPVPPPDHSGDNEWIRIKGFNDIQVRRNEYITAGFLRSYANLIYARFEENDRELTQLLNTIWEKIAELETRT